MNYGKIAAHIKQEYQASLIEGQLNKFQWIMGR